MEEPLFHDDLHGYHHEINASEIGWHRNWIPVPVPDCAIPVPTGSPSEQMHSAQPLEEGARLDRLDYSPVHGDYRFSTGRVGRF